MHNFRRDQGKINELVARHGLFSVFLALYVVLCRLSSVLAYYDRYYPSTLAQNRAYSSSYYSSYNYYNYYYPYISWYMNVFENQNLYGESDSTVYDNFAAQYPNCIGPVYWIGNGYCEGGDTNNEPCGYDGGDCCSCDCSSSDSECFFGGVDCIDPNMSNQSCDPGEQDASASYYAYAREEYQSSYYSHYDSAPTPEEYPNCSGFFWWIGNNWCDFHLNNPSCGYDGGDCCHCNCSSRDSEFFYDGIHCIDPNLLNQSCSADECEDYSSVYPNCTGYIPSIGDARCDRENNIPSCGYDGGDCCFCTCVSTEDRECGTYGFFCLDSEALNDASCDLPDDYSPYFDNEYLAEYKARLEQFPNCHGNVQSIGDGKCDYTLNNLSCDFDGGDCCPCTCASTENVPCGINGYDCIDPDTESLENLCSSVPQAISPCSSDLRTSWDLFRPQDVSSFARSTLCSGGEFEVRWHETIIVNETIYVVNNTKVHIIGAGSGAVADGAGVSRIFTVLDASLNVSDVTFSNCSAPVGGAIAAARSNLTFQRTAFLSNRAATYGGALFTHDGSSVSLREDLRFASNEANLSGGALFIANGSTVSWDGKVHFSSNRARNSGGAMHVLDTSNITWSGDVIFSRNTAGYGGAVSLWRVGELDSRINVTFVRNVAESGDGGAIFIGSGCTVKFLGVTNFTANEAVVNSGGAIGSSESESESADSRVTFAGSAFFVENKSGTNGGAISLLGGLAIVFALNDIFDFSGNSATISGGALYISDATAGPVFNEATFVANIAGEDGGAAYVAASGVAKYRGRFSNPTTFYRCLFKGNQAKGSGGAISSSSGVDFVYATEFIENSARAGGAIRLAGQRARVTDCSFVNNSSDEMEGPAISHDGIVLEVMACLFQRNFFQCPAGKFVDTNVTSQESRYYQVCVNCLECLWECNVPENNTIPICRDVYKHTRSRGGKVDLQSLHVEPAYWRATKSSRVVLPCYNPEACQGGLTDSPKFCDDRYMGPYCAVCAKGFASRIQYKCEKCEEEEGGMALIAVFAVIVALLGLALIWYLILAENGLKGRGLVRRIMRNMPVQSIKIMIVVWQIITQFASAANVTYPAVYQRFLNIVRLINFELEWALSAACILDVDFHYRFLSITIGPLVGLALLGVTYSIAFFRNRHCPEALQYVRDKHTTILLWLTLLVYSSASSAVFRMFACDTLDDNEGYRERFLRTDYRINCDSPKHRALEIYAACMIIVYPIGIPSFYAVILFRQRKLLQDGRRRDRVAGLRSISTLWNPYTPQRFYYEVIECVRRMWLAGAVAFIYPNTAAQIAMTLVIALIFAFLCEGLAPYSSALDAWVSRTGHGIVFFSMYVALLGKVDVSHERSESQDIFAGVLVGAHVCMMGVIFIEAIVLIFWARVREEEEPRLNGGRPLSTSDFSRHSTFSSVRSSAFPSRRVPDEKRTGDTFSLGVLEAIPEDS